MKQIIRKVCIVFGKWGKDTDFVLEPVCKSCEVDGHECEICENSIYITEVKGGNMKKKLKSKLKKKKIVVKSKPQKEKDIVEKISDELDELVENTKK